MKTLFLTGGTGFVGSHVAARFLLAGWRVKALVRRPERRGLLPPGAFVVRGEVNAPSAYQPHLEDCDVIIHAAGILHAPTLAAMEAVNVQGTVALAHAAAQACPHALFIPISSQAAAGPARNGSPVTESDRPQPISWYGKSKLGGERAVEKHFPGPWVIIRPSAVYGPGDRGFLEMFSVVSRGVSPILSGGRCRVQLLAAHDLARILLAVAHRPDLAGRRGFVAGETAQTGEVARYLASLRQPPARCIPVPALAVRLAGVVESIRETLTGQSLPFNRDKALEIVQRDWLCDSAPFLRELGVNGLKPWREGFLETCRWYMDRQWLPRCFSRA